MTKILAALFLAGAAAAASAEGWIDPHSLSGSTLSYSDSFRKLTAFPEHLVYDVSWGVIGVGQATLEVEEVRQFHSRSAYHIVSRAVSNGFCDTFYKVRDVNESWLDAVELRSLAYAKQLREGRFFRDESVVYDYASKTYDARWFGRDGSYSVRSGTIPVSVQDILSSLYYVRSRDLVPGSDVVLDVNTKDNWPLVVRVVRKESIKTPAGRFDTILVEPALRQEGIFIQKGKKLQVWLTDDAKKAPVQMKVEVFFGHVTAKLAKML